MLENVDGDKPQLTVPVGVNVRVIILRVSVPVLSCLYSLRGEVCPQMDRCGAP